MTDPEDFGRHETRPVASASELKARIPTAMQLEPVVQVHHLRIGDRVAMLDRSRAGSITLPPKGPAAHEVHPAAKKVRVLWDNGDEELIEVTKLSYEKGAVR